MESFFGYLLLLLGLAGTGFMLYKFFQSKTASTESGRVTQEKKLPTDELPPDADIREKLKKVQKGQIINLTGEGDKVVKASITLHEMTQEYKNAPWSKTGVVSKTVLLSGGIWIFKIPSREAGKSIWLRGKELDTMALAVFYKGTPENPGPGRIFNSNGQSKPVPYQLPSGLTNGTTWNVVDIGTFFIETSGSCENAETGDRIYFVTSREDGGNRWLLYLDARKGEARGSGGLFELNSFEPSVDVMDLM
jgi:hypothetical protein